MTICTVIALYTYGIKKLPISALDYQNTAIKQTISTYMEHQFQIKISQIISSHETLF